MRILIDQGSELSFISEDLVQRLQLKRTTASIPLLGIGGIFSGNTRGIVTIRLQSIHDTTSYCSMRIYVIPKITTKLPSFDARCPSWPHIEGLQLADPGFSRSGSIQILIGSDNYGRIIMPGLIRGQPFSPIAQETIFGWVLSGPISPSDITLPAQGYHCSVDQDLQDILTKFWLQEEIPSSSDSSLSPDEIACEQHFISTHSRSSSGRYIIRLPLKASPTTLGDSKTTAVGCLRRLSQRLHSDANYKELYHEFLEEYMVLGHMLPVTSSDKETSAAYYLPHHGVLRKQSSTTKLRVVFNGSSKSSSGLSLNDILHCGAKLQRDITDILLWTRTHRIMFSTDVVKMFRQISVHEDDWDLQRILWFDSDGNLLTYKLTTVTYGLNCAPFLALRSIQQLIEDEGQRFPKAVPSLTKGRYVDDIFGGADSIQETKDIIRQLTSLCDAGGFPLQKWNSNCPEVLPQEPAKINKAAPIVEIEPALHKILGLVWESRSDTFHFTIEPSSITKFTKRTIASDIARLYDPLGLISPVLIQAKLILQELWLLKVSWDETLSPELQGRWEEFHQQLIELNQLSITRWLGTTRADNSIQIHGFSDASLLAMAAAVYIRSSVSEKEFVVRLMCSKTRVAPLKRLTIPRLELTAALLLAKLVARVLKTLDISNAPVFLWTDSSVALTWITSHPSRWKEFVRNRVAAIQELLPNASWKFISGKENPADCASRGLQPTKLIHHELWWSGPHWLSNYQDTWPSGEFRSSRDAHSEERPGQIMSTVTFQPTYWELLDKYSSLTKLLRITAICRRFISCLKQRNHSSLTKNPITPMELEEGRHYWARIVQKTWFPSEIQTISRGECLPRSNPMARLTPFIDRHGLLRVGGRLHHAQIDADAKHPIILPRKSPLTTLIIADAHRRTLHGGTQVTLGLIRQSFWIIGGRVPIRSHILKCVPCARYRGLRAKQLMGQLPPSRVSRARPFLNSGLDYAGPILVKTWKGRAARHYKGYLAIFVCFATSAVHIEVVTDYTTEAFIAAYKRFTGRRGVCATLQSDCGTNFVGADKALRQRFAESSKDLRDLASLLANDGTEWKFNPPSAPHFGGKWEAAVKSTKFHLKRLLGDTILTYEELTTVITQIEAVLNSRPLCPLSDDANDYSVLTPGHFLIGEALTLIPEPDLSTQPTSRLSRWQLLQQIVDRFWTKWSTECLQRFQARSKWLQPSHEIKEGSMVVVTDERYPPAKWPLARVTKLHPGPNGLTRVVTVRTTTGSYKRPITKVCVLPTDPDAEYSTTLLSKGGKCSVIGGI